MDRHEPLRHPLPTTGPPPFAPHRVDQLVDRTKGRPDTLFANFARNIDRIRTLIVATVAWMP